MADKLSETERTAALGRLVGWSYDPKTNALVHDFGERLARAGTILFRRQFGRRFAAPIAQRESRHCFMAGGYGQHLLRAARVKPGHEVDKQAARCCLDRQ